MDKNKLQQDIENIKNLPIEERAEILNKIPQGRRVKAYAQNCSKEQIKNLFDEWHKSGKATMIKKMVKRLKKKKIDYIPDFIKENYKYLF